MKKWILRWLGLAPKGLGNADLAVEPYTSDHRNFLPQVTARNMFEIINATNGKILVYNKHFSNPNGPDKNDMTIYLVNDGEDIMPIITKAMILAQMK